MSTQNVQQKCLQSKGINNVASREVTEPTPTPKTFASNSEQTDKRGHGILVKTQHTHTHVQKGSCEMQQMKRPITSFKRTHAHDVRNQFLSCHILQRQGIRPWDRANQSALVMFELLHAWISKRQQEVREDGREQEEEEKANGMRRRFKVVLET